MSGHATSDNLKPARGRPLPGHGADLLTDRRGAVFVEFLIAFLPVYIFFLSLLQLTILFSARLVTEHAAVHAARAAAVIVGDDPSQYGGEAPHQLAPDGEHAKTIRKAVILTLAPLILTGLAQEVEVVYPESDVSWGPPQTDTASYSAMEGTSVDKVRVRVEVDVVCRIGFANQIVCPHTSAGIGGVLSNTRTKLVRAEAMYPYQGARYAY